MKPDIKSESRFLPTPHAFDAPAKWGGVPPEYCYNIWYGKIRMVWLPEGEKNEYIFIRFDRMFERDRHTRADRRTDTV